MQALIISVYSEYFEEQRNGPVRLSSSQNSHVGDVFQVKTFVTNQWWTQEGFYHEVVKTSGNRLKELFPVRVMTQFNLPCELQCIEVVYVLESDNNSLYIIPAEHLSSSDYDHRPQPVIDQKKDFQGRQYFVSEIKLKWKLLYDDPSNIMIPQLSYEHNFVRAMKEIAYTKKEDHTTKVARILMNFVNFTKELEISRKHEEEKFQSALRYAKPGSPNPTWEEESLLCLKFNNTQERNAIFKSAKKNRRNKRRPRSSEELRPPTPFPTTLQVQSILSKHPNPTVSPPKKPFIQSDQQDKPERPKNPLSRTYEIGYHYEKMLPSEEEEEEDEERIQVTPEQEPLDQDQIDMITLEDKAWKKVDASLAQRLKQKCAPKLKTIPKVIRQHICPLDNRDHECPLDSPQQGSSKHHQHHTTSHPPLNQ